MSPYTPSPGGRVKTRWYLLPMDALVRSGFSSLNSDHFCPPSEVRYRITLPTPEGPRRESWYSRATSRVLTSRTGGVGRRAPAAGVGCPDWGAAWPRGVGVATGSVSRPPGGDCGPVARSGPSEAAAGGFGGGEFGGPAGLPGFDWPATLCAAGGGSASFGGFAAPD